MKSSLPNCFKKLSARGPPPGGASWQLENVEFEKRAITTLVTHWCGINISRGDS